MEKIGHKEKQKELNDRIWFKQLIESGQFWEEVKRKDEENIRNHVYGRYIIKTDSELDEVFK
jgi:hypothetical protein